MTVICLHSRYRCLRFIHTAGDGVMTAPVHTKTPAAISEYRAAAGAGEARSPQAEGVAPLNLDHHVPIWPVATEHRPTKNQKKPASGCRQPPLSGRVRALHLPLSGTTAQPVKPENTPQQAPSLLKFSPNARGAFLFNKFFLV